MARPRFLGMPVQMGKALFEMLKPLQLYAFAAVGAAAPAAAVGGGPADERRTALSPFGGKDLVWAL